MSYAEALQIYNQELLALDRLTAERAKLQESLTPAPTDIVGGLLEQAGQATAELEKTLEDFPGLDVTPDADETQSSDGLLEAVGQQLRESQQLRENQKQEITARIAELDKEITEQQARVERAKADKDAAEAARR